MPLEKNAMACNRFVQLVRDWAVKVKPWEVAVRYQVQPDEHRDLTLISQRVYGNRDEFLTIFAAAGLSTMDEPIKEQLLVLPTEHQLKKFKIRAGYENDHEKRLFMGA